MIETAIFGTAAEGGRLPQVESILVGLKPTIRQLAAGETLFATGDATRGFFVVRKGQIRLVRFGASGRETVLFVARPGERFAEASLFAGTYHCDAQAVTESTVACFPKTEALAMLQNDADARLDLTADFARQVMELRSALTLRDIRSARERLLAHLVAQAGADGRTVAIKGLLKDLAATIGLTPEVLYRTLAQLEAQRAIQRGDGTITLT
ncbi:MAG: Crp/Fnr family transcriptional regulator [Bosea sp.]|jgi:CRP/FNR family transcriptional regulator|nr:Crp/Fnr family transcriptional regulator [Bosea sp. (in: a-proteobacteria)]